MRRIVRATLPGTQCQTEPNGPGTGSWQPSKVEICSIELLKLQLEFLGSRDGCEIVNEYSMEDEIVSVPFHEYRLLVVNLEVLMLFNPG